MSTRCSRFEMYNPFLVYSASLTIHASSSVQLAFVAQGEQQRACICSSTSNIVTLMSISHVTYITQRLEKDARIPGTQLNSIQIYTNKPFRSE
jgi:hypothetical protein